MLWTIEISVRLGAADCGDISICADKWTKLVERWNQLRESDQAGVEPPVLARLSSDSIVTVRCSEEVGALQSSVSHGGDYRITEQRSGAGLQLHSLQ